MLFILMLQLLPAFRKIVIKKLRINVMLIARDCVLLSVIWKKFCCEEQLLKL